MAESSYSVFNALIDIVTSPVKAFDEIRPRTSWLWWPLLISILLAASMFIYYYSWVDFPWLVEETIRRMPVEDRGVSADPIRQFMEPASSMWLAVIAVVVMTLFIYLVQATYFHLVNKLTTGAEIGFGQWFSFSAWSGVVSVFGSLAAFVVIFLSDSNQVAEESLQVFSLNSLLFHLSPGETWFRWVSTLTLINFWMLFLMSIGYARWTGASMVKATVIAVLPWAAFFGLWAMMVSR